MIFYAKQKINMHLKQSDTLRNRICIWMKLDEKLPERTENTKNIVKSVQDVANGA